MMGKLIFIFVSIISIGSHAQKDSAAFFNDFNFIIHLSKNKLFGEAERERTRLFKTEGMDQLYRDSINFYLGQSYYTENRKREAKSKFMQISDQPFFYYKARYAAGIIDAEDNRIDSAIANLHAIEQSTSSDLNELRTFELSGLYLLNKNYRAFDSLAQISSFTNPLLSEEFQNLKKCYAVEKKIRRKSAFLAGTLSAIIPGLGKVYVGNNGQALASFLTVGLMGAIATENYLKWGIEHPQTIFFTGMFGLFYIGNIWGSAVSVQLVKIEKQLENKHNILVGLKLPVSKFFN
jgi:hypothetical protein